MGKVELTFNYLNKQLIEYSRIREALATEFRQFHYNAKKFCYPSHIYDTRETYFYKQVEHIDLVINLITLDLAELSCYCTIPTII